VVTSSRSANAADARPPLRPFGLWPPSTLAALLAPHILRGMLEARALPASLGAISKVGLLLRDRPLAIGTRPRHSNPNIASSLLTTNRKNNFMVRFFSFGIKRLLTGIRCTAK